MTDNESLTEVGSEKLRAFVALSLAPDTRDALTRASRDLQNESWAEEIRWVRPENLHLTLRFLGDIEEAGVKDLLDVLAERMRSIEAFSFAIGGLSLFPSAARPRVVAADVIREQPLIRLASEVEAAVVAAGYRADPRDFRAHITLGRFRRGRRRGLTIAAALQVVSLAVESVVLFRSTLGPTGARYTELGRASLADRSSS
jgi:2'-5' RNA ligase